MRVAKVSRRIVNAIIILFLVVLFLLCTPIVALFSIGLEDEFTKWEIDNPHVDSNFSGWQEISLYSFDTFKIPETWVVENANGILSIKNSDGDLWALGTVYGTETDLFPNYSEFITTFIPTNSTDVSIDTYSGFSAMGGSDINKILVHSSDNTETYYYIKLRDPSGTSLVFILFADLTINSDDFDIAEAIVYSFAY